MIYCKHCRKIVEDDRYVQSLGYPAHEVKCFKCLNKPFCVEPNCTNLKSTGTCRKCHETSEFCDEHYTLKAYVVTTICNCLRETSKDEENCRRNHYGSELANVCQKCYNERCTKNPTCGNSKAPCFYCYDVLESCGDCSMYQLINQKECHVPVCKNCYVKYQCWKCKLHKTCYNCHICKLMFCEGCETKQKFRKPPPKPKKPGTRIMGYYPFKDTCQTCYDNIEPEPQ